MDERGALMQSTPTWMDKVIRGIELISEGGTLRIVFAGSVGAGIFI